MNLSSRIQEKLTEKGWSVTELARRAGMQQPTLHRIISGVTQEPKIDSLERIAKALGVDLQWLRSGKVAQRPDSNAVLIDTDFSDEETSTGMFDAELPFFEEVELAAGDGKLSVIENSSHTLRFSLDKLSRAGVSASNAACAVVSGDSMEPLIPSGSTVAIDKGFKRILDGEIYAINHDGMLRIKKLYRMPMNRIRVVSENHIEFPEEIISADDLDYFKIIGRIFWWEVVRTPNIPL
ncbi:MAG: hypothetical protein CMH98_19020 [Oceanospirillaceae bacterium]|nr:hypothetical protein [Oceanospirillaceae bacterium]